jgi:hypothetical protein
MSTTEALAVQEPRALTAAEHRAHVNLIQQVMAEVMKEGTHFGKIPGTDKPSLWKPGAEILGTTFHIAVDPQVEADLSTDDVIRYRIRAAATSQNSGAFLGAGLGECSSNEEKYKWRAAVCTEEFDETPVDRRRRKWKRAEQSYAVNQVRTEPADIANTVLKMAVKRAAIAVILQVTAASDCFTQDIEDLPEEIQNEVAGEGQPRAERHPKREERKAPGAGGDTISDAQKGRCFAIGKNNGWSVDQYRALVKRHGFESDKVITKGDKYNAICAELERGPGAGDKVPDGFK